MVPERCMMRKKGLLCIIPATWTLDILCVWLSLDRSRTCSSSIGVSIIQWIIKNMRYLFEIIQFTLYFMLHKHLLLENVFNGYLFCELFKLVLTAGRVFLTAVISLFLQPVWSMSCYMWPYCCSTTLWLMHSVLSHSSFLPSLSFPGCFIATLSVSVSVMYWRFSHSWFQTFAMFWMLYAFFWVIPRHLNFISRHFGTQASS